MTRGRVNHTANNGWLVRMDVTRAGRPHDIPMSPGHPRKTYGPTRAQQRPYVYAVSRIARPNAPSTPRPHSLVTAPFSRGKLPVEWSRRRGRRFQD